MSLLTFKDIENQYKKMGITKELAGRFIKRTREHIQRVIANADKLEKAFPDRFPGLGRQVKDHDQSKYRSPELEPYVWLTEYHRCKDNKIPFEYPKGMKEKVDKATLYHIQNNSHHAEFFDPNKDEIELGKNRDSLAKMSDATEMDRLSLVEMICDWAAMGQEKGTSLKEWADKNVNKRWKFTDEQVDLIDELVGFFEPETDEGGPDDKERKRMKESFHHRLDRALNEAVAEGLDDWMARCFNVGPKAKPIKPKTRTCPKCGGPNAYVHEAHADTGFDEMVLRCPDCRKDSDL